MSPFDAQDAVLRDNLFGLELDPRCVQIAMFAVALQAWKAGGGWRQLPLPNIACSGIPVKASADEWKGLADGASRLESALIRLHVLFRDADTFGSLIDPRQTAELADPTSQQKSLDDVDWDNIMPVLSKAIQGETRDSATAVLGADAVAVARAVNFLSRRYVLIITNPPFLGQRESVFSATRLHCTHLFGRSTGSRDNFSNEGARELGNLGATAAFVLPQNWLTLGSYKVLRKLALNDWTVRVLANLGSGAFAAIGGEVVKPVLAIIEFSSMPENVTYLVDAASEEGADAKSHVLVDGQAVRIEQKRQLTNPDARILFEVLPTQRSPK